MSVQKRPASLSQPVDMNGDVLEVGFYVTATHDKQEYTGRITGFENFHGPVKRVVLRRVDDNVEMKTFSDAVARNRNPGV